MAKDRQWVVLDNSQNANKDREAAAKETPESKDETYADAPEGGRPDDRTPGP